MADIDNSKNNAYEGTRIIVNTEDLMFLEVLAPDSLGYFGLDWVKNRYDRFRDGNLYLIVDKRELPVNVKVLYTDTDGEFFGYYQSGDTIKYSELLLEYPELVDQITALEPVSEIYDALLSISEGQELSKYNLRNIDDLVSDFKFNKRSPRASSVMLSFDDVDDILGIFDVSEDDKWFVGAVTSYDSYEFEYWDNVHDDWLQGYGLDHFSGVENETRIDNILKVILPGHSINTNDDKERELICNTLEAFFQSEIEDVLDTYIREQNYCKTRGTLKEIESDVSNLFEPYNIFKVGEGYNYVTSVKTLLSLYENVGSKKYTLKELLAEINKDTEVGGWAEYMYETECDEFDQVTMDRTVSQALDSMEEGLEDSDKFEDIEEFKKMADFILSKYDLNRNYETPKDSNIRFTIHQLDPSDNSVLVTVKNLEKRTSEKRRLDLEGFNNLLTQQELFQ
jgi:hypothetical protein